MRRISGIVVQNPVVGQDKPREDGISRRAFVQRALLAIGALALGAQAPTPPVPHPPPVRQADPTGLYRLFFCTCGCRMNLRDCVCETGKLMRSKIDGYVSQGLTKDDVLQKMVNEYSLTVLQEPGKKGFNWFWYITPFVLFGAGGAVVYHALKANSTPSKMAEAGGTGEARPSSEQEQLTKEIEDRISEDL
ncbi:MAG: cytochrome c-type biogenesis protein CcmH [bacterium]